MKLENLTQEEINKIFAEEAIIAGARKLYFENLSKGVSEYRWTDALLEEAKTIDMEVSKAARIVHTFISKYGVKKLEEKITNYDSD